MEYKILDKENLNLMEKFIDDENTKYEKENLIKFLNEKNAIGFIAEDKGKIISFAYIYY